MDHAMDRDESKLGTGLETPLETGPLGNSPALLYLPYD